MKKEILRKSIHSALAISFAVAATYAQKELSLKLSLELLLVSAVVLFVVFLLIRIARIRTFAHRVSRVSYGELFFALGIAGALLVAWPDIRAFQLSMVVLALADPLAALIGQRFGTHTYTVFGEKRSIEGSLACAIAVLVIFLSFGASLTVASVGAVVLTVVEAMALWGSDNFFLPVVAILLYQFL